MGMFHVGFWKNLNNELKFYKGGFSININHDDLEYDEGLMSVELKMKQNGDKSVINLRSELVRINIKNLTFDKHDEHFPFY